MMKSRFFLLLAVLPAVTARANDSLILRSLKRIAQLQPKESSVFPKGSIPSYRLYAWNGDRQKADINAFYTGLTVFTLRDIQQQFSAEQQRVSDAIVHRALPVFAKFRNRSGRYTYNFWPTDTAQIFPNAGWMNWFNRSQALPDDMDDTVILLMAQRAQDSVAKAVHALMQGYTNSGERNIHNTFAGYKHIAAYSTWFGKKMPVDFDVCVLANTLYFVQSYRLPWTAADSASLLLIEKVLSEKKHMHAAAYVSPHYNRSANILYHLSRLMALRPIPSLEKYRPQLIAEAGQAFADARSFMEEVILSTALLRWGAVPPQGKAWHATGLTELIEDERFSFFIANMASMLPDPLKQWLHSAGKFYYHAPAYNHVLFIENLVWRKKNGLG
ncbi:hypothetical protein [Sediminibacterium soli]|uniref:hypothetical protein n=1 Tax=Sediminibacterium soli TaxID=2698829 RepID=UPI00137B73DF|nr:hypothetical protein [Sediminibacterium soli]NCI46359.1 hypothetical protein [Sediminibacterium soli]